MPAVDVSRLRTALLDLLFPPRCVNCKKRGVWFCAACLAAVPRIVPPLCRCCGEPLEHPRERPGDLCYNCRREPLQIDGIRSVALFEGPLRQAVHHLKYTGQRDLATSLGSLLAEYWQGNPLPADVLVPVPLHESRQRERGYNQASLLAQELAATAGLPVIEGCLVRARQTASQMTLKRLERKTNVRDAFACADGRLAGRQVLLLDDVCTTGATLEACAIACRQAGARSVWALTLAREK
jgi:ComF family protein